MVRVRKNVSRCIAASGKKSGIGAVLSEQSSFAEVSLNRRRALRILSRINNLRLIILLTGVSLLSTCGREADTKTTPGSLEYS